MRNTLALLILFSTTSLFAQDFLIEGTYEEKIPCTCYVSAFKTKCTDDFISPLNAFHESRLSETHQFGSAQTADVITDANGRKTTVPMRIFSNGKWGEGFKVRANDKLSFKITDKNDGFKITVRNLTKAQPMYAFNLTIPEDQDTGDYRDGVYSHTVLDEAKLENTYIERRVNSTGSAGPSRPGPGSSLNSSTYNFKINKKNDGKTLSVFYSHGSGFKYREISCLLKKID